MDRAIFEKFTALWVQQQGKLDRALQQYGLYALFITAYPEYAFDPTRPNAFHVHPWDIGRVGVWMESMIKEAVRHTVHFHIPKGLTLGETLRCFTYDFLEQEYLVSPLVAKFGSNPYRFFVYGFPEYAFDPMHPDRPHIHPWDAHSTEWTDDLVLEAIPHMVKYHTNWQEEELPSRVTCEWLNETRLGGALSKFGDSPFQLLQFTCSELFKRGILREEHFKHLRFGRGAGRFRHPLRLIPKRAHAVVGVKDKRLYFPKHRGCFFHRLSQEYGTLYNREKQLVGLFRWNTDPDVAYVNIGEEDIEPVPPELTQTRHRLTFTEAVRVLADEVRIVVYDLPLEDQTALTDALNTVEPSYVVKYLKLTGESGLRAMADTEFHSALILVHGMFDPAEFRQVLFQYNTINGKLAEISGLFTRHVTAVPQEILEAFRAQLHAKLFDASDRILNTLSKALIYRNQEERITLIADVLQAQRDLSAIIEVLDSFRHGTLRLIRRENHQGGTRDIQYASTVMDVYLVLRPRQDLRGQARIGFQIVPHLPLEDGLSPRLSLRWDRETASQTALDIHSDALVRLNRLDSRSGGYHYALASGNRFANTTFFERIVTSFLPS
ncbi:MAG: hypothetical protein Q8Q94_03420 [bacterium]|nr:hypothetical protein [bacterium]